jgi:tRNA(fMet)-specific endonuclease VapC
LIVLLDTNFLIDLLGGRVEARELAAELDQEGATIRIPSPVLFELWEGVDGAADPREERKHLEALSHSYDIVPLDEAAAQIAGRLQSTLERDGRKLGTIDALVAGIAISRAESVVTGDSRLMNLGQGLDIRGYRRRSRERES